MAETIPLAEIDFNQGVRFNPPISRLGATQSFLRAIFSPEEQVSRKVAEAVWQAAQCRNSGSPGDTVFVSPACHQPKLVAVVNSGGNAKVFLDRRQRRPS